MYLGLDLGTSAVKAVLCGRDLRVLAEASTPLTISHPQPGWAEQEPTDWWAACVTSVRALRAQGPVNVACIGLSGQMHGAVMLDAEQAPLRPAILWNDGRAAPVCENLREPALEAQAGVRAMAGFTAPKLAWLVEQAPECLKTLRHVVSPKDYIGFRLHGQIVTDLSDAAGTWWLNQATGRWSAALCAATRTDMAALPPILPSATIAGYLQDGAAVELGLPAGVPVIAGAGDAVAGAVSLGAETDGFGFVSLGTSGQLFVATERYSAAPDQGVHSFAHARPGLWYQMAAMLNGARPMAWLAEMTRAPLPDLLAEAAEVPSGQAPLCLPYLTGERTPHNDASIRGAFIGLQNDTSRGAMMRAVIDAIAYSFADAKRAVEATRPLPPELHVIGGGARSDLLLQTLSDVLGIRLLRGAEASVGPALGAARLAARAMGQEPELEHGDLQVFEPQDATTHQPRLTAYRALYQALKPIRF